MSEKDEETKRQEKYIADLKESIKEDKKNLADMKKTIFDKEEKEESVVEKMLGSILTKSLSIVDKLLDIVDKKLDNPELIKKIENNIEVKIGKMVGDEEEMVVKGFSNREIKWKK